MFLQRGVLQPRKEVTVNFGCPPVYHLDNLALGEYIEKYLPDADVKEAKEIYKEFERKGEK